MLAGLVISYGLASAELVPRFRASHRIRNAANRKPGLTSNSTVLTGASWILQPLPYGVTSSTSTYYQCVNIRDRCKHYMELHCDSEQPAKRRFHESRPLSNVRILGVLSTIVVLLVLSTTTTYMKILLVL